MSLPFGDQETCLPQPTEHLFTGKERDAESANDYFGARYYASALGRWLSPDFDGAQDDMQPVPYADLNNPQTLNLYQCVHNNPVSGIDEVGHFMQVGPGCHTEGGTDGKMHVVCGNLFEEWLNDVVFSGSTPGEIRAWSAIKSLPVPTWGKHGTDGTFPNMRRRRLLSRHSIYQEETRDRRDVPQHAT